MDPPRQVSRRGPGSGPVFRTFKRLPTPAFPPHHYSSTTQRSSPTQPIVSFPQSISEQNVPKGDASKTLSSRSRSTSVKAVASSFPADVKLHKLTSGIEDNKNDADANRIQTRSKPVKVNDKPDIVLGPRTRCRPFKFEETVLWASAPVVVANAANASLQRNISPDTTRKARDRSRKNKLYQLKKLNDSNRAGCAASEKISVSPASENPTLDSLWTSAAEQWKEPSEEDAALLQNLMAESLSGCIDFIKHDYRAESIKTESSSSISEKTSRNFVSREIVRSGRCLPPVGMLRCANEVSSYKSESNELLEILAQAGGVDEGVWQQLHRLYDLQVQSSSTFPPAAVPSSSSGHSSSSSNNNNSSSGSSSSNSSSSSSNSTNSSSSRFCASSPRHSCSEELDYTSASTAARPDSQHQDGVTADSREREMESGTQQCELLTSSSTYSSFDSDADADVAVLNEYKKRFSQPINSAVMAVAEANSLAARHRNRIGGAFGGLEIAPTKVSPKDHKGKKLNGRNGNRMTTAACNSFPLGRRGIRYTDVWDEEDFIRKTNGAHTLTAVDDWSTLLQSYSDTHDGSYRDWSIRNTTALAEASKKDTVLSSSRWSRVAVPPNAIGNDSGDGGLSILAPPVPVSLIHPSCWSMTARNVAQNSYASVLERAKQSEVATASGLTPGIFELIHPAALSSSIVELPGAAALREGLTDIDDLTILADALLREVSAVEASNYLRLQSLSRATSISRQLSGVRQRKSQVTEALILMYQRNEYEYHADRQLAYTRMPKPPNPIMSSLSRPEPSAQHLVKDKGRSSVPLDAPDASPATQLPRYSTRFASSSAVSALPTVTVEEEKKKESWNQLGACRVDHVAHGPFVAALTKGDPVEVYREGKWRAGRVLSIRSDDYLMRLVKVGALGGSAGDHVWVAVEDGRISPPGTHLVGPMFRWMYPSLSIDRPSTTKSGRVPSTAPASSSVAGCGRDNVTADSTFDGGLDVSKKRKAASSKTPPKSKSSKYSKESRRTPVTASKETDNKSDVETATEMESCEPQSAIPLEKTTRLLPLTLCAVLKEKEKDKIDPVEKKMTLWNLLKDCGLTGVSAPALPPPLDDLDIFLMSKPEYCVFDKEVHGLPTDTSGSPSPQTDISAHVLSRSDLLPAARSKSPSTVAASNSTMAVSAADVDANPAVTENPTQSIEICHAAACRVAESPKATTTPPLSMQSSDDDAVQEAAEHPSLPASVLKCHSVHIAEDPAPGADSAPDEVPVPLPLPIGASSEYLFAPLPPLSLLAADLQHSADLDLPEGSETDSTARRVPSQALSRYLVSCDDLDLKPLERAACAPPAGCTLVACEPRRAASWTRPSWYRNSDGSNDATSAPTLQSAGTTTHVVPVPPPVAALSVSDSTALQHHTCVSATDVVYTYVTPSHDDATEDAACDAVTSKDCSSQHQYRCLRDDEPIGASNICTARDMNSAKLQNLEGLQREYWLDNERIGKCLGDSSWLVRDSGADFGLSEGSSQRSPSWRRPPNSHDRPDESAIANSRRRSRDRSRDRQPEDRSEEAKSGGSRRDTSLQNISDEEGVQDYLPDCLDDRARGCLRMNGRGGHFVRGGSTDEGSSRDDVSSERGRSVDGEVESARWMSTEKALGRERKRWRSKEEVVSAMIEAVKSKRRGEGGLD